MAMMVMMLDMVALAEQLSERAEREFRSALDRVTVPVITELVREIREDLDRYYAPYLTDLFRSDKRKESMNLRVSSTEDLAQVLGLAMVQILPLVYQLGLYVEPMLSPSDVLAYASIDGRIVFRYPLFYVKNWKDNSVCSVSPDSTDAVEKGEAVSSLVYTYGDHFDDLFSRIFDISYGESVGGVKVKYSKDDSSNDSGFQPELVIWPDDLPMFDTAMLAALMLHETAHIALGHFQPVVNGGLRARMRRCVSDSIGDVGLDEKARTILFETVTQRLMNIVLDAAIHTVAPYIPVILDIAMRRRIVVVPPSPCEAGGDQQCDSDQQAGSDSRGSGSGSDKRIGEGKLGDQVSPDDVSGVDDQSQGSGQGDGGSDSELRKRVRNLTKEIHRGSIRRETLMRSVDVAEEARKVFEKIAESKSIGSKPSALFQMVSALFAKLRRDPLARFNAARAVAARLFGVPSKRTNHPRPDEQYLYRQGKIRYLPRLVRQPVRKRLLVVLDTSGSMGSDAIARAIGFVNELLKGQNYLFDFVVCDAEPHLVGTELMRLPQEIPCPRGGTVLGEAVRFAKENRIPVEGVVMITDGYNTDWGVEDGDVKEMLVVLADTNGNEVTDEYVRDVLSKVKDCKIEVVRMSDCVETSSK
jgi:predicted metal-dependent peptidase